MNGIADKEPLVWIEFEINDFKQFKEVVHDWSLDFHQLDDGSLHSKLEQLIFPEIQIEHTCFDCHLDQKGSSPDKKVIISSDQWLFPDFHSSKTFTENIES